jgi:N-methylhydantoinase B/oxoprolinase/acetone carboxylase alpha subunit
MKLDRETFESAVSEMTKETKKAIIENIQPFKKGHVSLYMSAEAKAVLDKIAFDLTGSQQGRSITLEAMINFCNAHIVNLEAWFKGMNKGENQNAE